MKKRGISPLIATVLIIGFTIVVGSLILIWGGDLLDKIKSDTETKSLTKLTCATKINLNIINACDMSNSVIINIENKGDKDINGLIVRLIGDETKVEKVEEKFSSYGVRKITIPYVDITDLKTIDVFPRVLIDGEEATCEPSRKDVEYCEDIDLPDVNLLDDWLAVVGGPLQNVETDIASIFPEEQKNEFNLNGYGLTGSGSLTMESRYFVISEDFSGIRFGSWVNKDYEYKLVDENDDEVSSVQSGNFQDVAYGTFILQGLGKVKLVATGTDLITLSEIYLYE